MRMEKRSYIKRRSTWHFITASEPRLENNCPPASVQCIIPKTFQKRWDSPPIGWMVMATYRAAGVKCMAGLERSTEQGWSNSWGTNRKARLQCLRGSRAPPYLCGAVTTNTWKLPLRNWLLIWVHKVIKIVMHAGPVCLHCYLACLLWVRLLLSSAHKHANIEQPPFKTARRLACLTPF